MWGGGGGRMMDDKETKKRAFGWKERGQYS